ncbi:MAG: sigma-54-dependent Fis family transcriptional regulator [Chlorobi bacterium]|nr:sigma-54-dependent Fis family transcriptional regulator [Chlorobiota bacterium]
MASNDVSILVVDDERAVRDSLYGWFTEDGYEVDTAVDAQEALTKLQQRSFDLALLDIKLPGMDGMELQQRIREVDPELPVIMITAYASIETAVKALKSGAFDYVTKPFDPDNLSRLVRNAIRQKQLARENVRLRAKISDLTAGDQLIGESEAMQKVRELIKTVAATDSTVVIHGESGTGKELVARAIHHHSDRRYFPIVDVNCGALAESILESELFGHEKGAFTGAHQTRKGKLEIADGGTLFLDEIASISMKMQVELLRVLETKQFSRVGGNKIITSDFRVICATNRNLEAAVAEGTFREDLYYRINVFSIYLPPLRERRSDIPLLADHFLKTYALAMNKPIREISPEALDILVRYEWPGNVRELENAIERAMVVGTPPAIRPEDLPMSLERSISNDSDALAEVEKRHIAHVLDKYGWNISHAAQALKIDRVTLYNKIKRYGLQRP